jgi:hypothetical protein
MVEQTENATTEQNSEQEAPTSKDASRKRIQSEIEFPYSDLESAVELARKLHSKAGTSCEDDELAAWLNQSPDGGTYRSRRSGARMFGLIDITQGTIRLTDLGRDISESHTERGARVEAFLKPALYQAMYEQGRGHTLPPPVAIERQMEQLGVSPKQKGRARQAFQKSAVYAGFVDASTGRFIKPGNSGIERPAERDDPDKYKGTGGGGGNGGGPKDPLIAALIQKLPSSGDWPAADRVVWLRMAIMAFDMAYGRSGEIEVKATVSAIAQG